MKIRRGFVSNSSSTVYVISNLTTQVIDLVQFVKENPQVVDEWNSKYGGPRYENEDLVKDALEKNVTWKPMDDKIMEFGDNDGTAIGTVYDYCLRCGGKSKSFAWKFLYYNR